LQESSINSSVRFWQKKNRASAPRNQKLERSNFQRRGEGGRRAQQAVWRSPIGRRKGTKDRGNVLAGNPKQKGCSNAASRIQGEIKSLKKRVGLDKWRQAERKRTELTDVGSP